MLIRLRQKRDLFSTLILTSCVYISQYLTLIMKQNAIHTTNNTRQEIEIATKVKAIFGADWIHTAIMPNTTQFIINWNKSGMKTLNHYMIREIEDMTDRKLENMAIHSNKCISLIFFGGRK